MSDEEMGEKDIFILSAKDNLSSDETVTFFIAINGLQCK